jgi:hypothetical protein
MIRFSRFKKISDKLYAFFNGNQLNQTNLRRFEMLKSSLFSNKRTLQIQSNLNFSNSLLANINTVTLLSKNNSSLFNHDCQISYFKSKNEIQSFTQSRSITNKFKKSILNNNGSSIFKTKKIISSYERHGDHSSIMHNVTSNSEEMKLAMRITYLGLVFNVVFTIGKAVVGYITNSAALIADAVHSGSDLFSDIVTLWAVKIARRPHDGNFFFQFIILYLFYTIFCFLFIYLL